LDIVGLGEKLVEQLVAKRLVMSPADLFSLTTDQIADLDRMGEKSAQKLIQAIATRRKTSLSRLIFGLGIRHVGQVVAETLADHLGSLQSLVQTDEETLTAIPDVGTVVAKSLTDWAETPANRALIERLHGLHFELTTRSPNRGVGEGILVGHTAVVTGTLPTLGRKAATELLKHHGAKVGSGVSKVTTFVLAGDDAGSKLKKATELGIAVISESELQEWIGEGTLPSSLNAATEKESK
jgi:DNA ligase (NAD+)